MSREELVDEDPPQTDDVGLPVLPNCLAGTPSLRHRGEVKTKGMAVTGPLPYTLLALATMLAGSAMAFTGPSLAARGLGCRDFSACRRPGAARGIAGHGEAEVGACPMLPQIMRRSVPFTLYSTCGENRDGPATPLGRIHSRRGRISPVCGCFACLSMHPEPLCALPSSSLCPAGSRMRKRGAWEHSRHWA